MNGRFGASRAPYWHLALFAVAILLVAVLAFRQFIRSSTTKVWVASAELPSGSVVGGSELESKRVSHDRVSSATLGRSQIEGRTLYRSKTSGEPFVVSDFERPPESLWLAEAMPEGRIVSAVRVSDATLPVEHIRQGDRLDVVSVARDGSSQVVGRDAWVLGWINGKAESAPTSDPDPFGLSLIPSKSGRNKSRHSSIKAFVLGLRPKDVVPVAQAEAMGTRITFVLHGRQEALDGVAVVIPSPSQSTEVDLIEGSGREQVKIGAPASSNGGDG